MRFSIWIALVVIVVLLSQPVKAQMVTIPDPNFLIFLQNSDVAGCLIGNQLDASCPAVVNKTILSCGNSNIGDLTGLEAFVNLETLWCPGNILTVLPTLPTQLEALHCYNNTLGTLPTLPTTLTALYCYSNQLTELPTLPSSLVYLDCSGNQLTSLPDLPNSLETLNSVINQLTALPSLPSSLTDLTVDVNQLTALPTLPPALYNLTCVGNQLTALPNLPSTLYSLHCGDNQITALPELPLSLWSLGCHSNELTALPSLPSSLERLHCNDNLLTALPSLPVSLTELYCADNQLTVIPPLPSVMSILFIANNPGVTCLPPLEKLTGQPFSSSIAGTAITCLPNIIQHTGSIPSIDNLPLCDIFNSGGCDVVWNISGKVFRDDNSNCIISMSVPNLQNIKLQLLQSGNVQQQVFSNGAGSFSFDTDLGTYETRVDTTGLPFNIICPANNAHTSTLIATDSLDFTADFALQCKPGYDVAVQSVVHSAGLFFPVQQATVAIHAGDLVQYYGTTCNTAGLAGFVAASFTGPVSVASVSGNGLVDGNSVTWAVSDFSQLDFVNDFTITFLTDTFPPQGVQVCIMASVVASVGVDNNPVNNNLMQCFNVVNSFDPNFKEVYPSSVSQPGEYHTYTVHFQNTGTAAAQHIVIKDTLDSNLDWTSFQRLGASHNDLTQVLQNGIVHFNFPNINLPDSNSNEPDSHGWIQYKIRSNNNIQPGTTIHNTAAIYFDFNDPIITNDAVVTYCQPVETEQSFSICEGDSVNVGENWYSESGAYANLFTSSSGCDSTVTTNLVVYPITAYVENYNLCPGDSVVVNDVVYHQPVSWVDTAADQFGCPMLLYTNIIGINIDTSVTEMDNALVAPDSMFAYQWIDCATGLEIEGATQQIFTPLASGSYAVELTSNEACVVTSSCRMVVITALHDFSKQTFALFPNPASGVLHVTFSAEVANVFHQGGPVVEIQDAAGRTVMTKPFTDGSTLTLDIGALANGVYRVRLMAQNRVIAAQKLVVTH